MKDFEIINLGLSDPLVQLEGYRGIGNKACILVLPGGAYAACAEPEGRPIAEFFAEHGYAAFTLRYSTLWSDFANKEAPVNTHTIFPEPVREVAAAIKYIKDNRASLYTNGNIVVCGFSAGGHLAASYGNTWFEKEICSGIAAEPEEIRPMCQILSYSVTKLKAEPKIMMNRAIFGKWDISPDADELSLRSPVENVSDKTPPTFMWHSAKDNMVSVNQTINMGLALQNAGVIYEVHIYPFGPHASGLSNGLPAENWKVEAIRFIEHTEKETKNAAS